MFHRLPISEPGFPPEQPPGLLRRDEPSLEIALSVVHKRDVCLLPENLLERPDNLQNADLLPSVDVEDLVRRCRLHTCRIAAGKILHIDELPRLTPVAVDGDRFSGQQFPDEDRRDGLRTGPLSERDAEPHDRVGHAVQAVISSCRTAPRRSWKRCTGDPGCAYGVSSVIW